ncbi:MAG: pilus assembly protein PilP [Candidatus Acidiferrales bacterium]
MTKLANQFVKSVAVLAVALSFGTAVLAQGKPTKKPRPAHRARKAIAAKSVAKAVTAAPVAPPQTNADSSAAPTAASTTDLVGKRDPFVALVNTAKGGTEHLPPGKAGLVIGTLTVQGTVQGANGMIAVIANPDQKVYFVRQGDRLYDGDVEKISLDEVTFEQNTKDAFGKPIERTVVKRIYPSAGEQQ